MNFLFETAGELAKGTVSTVWLSLVKNWHILAISVVLASTLRTWTDMRKVAAMMQKRGSSSVVISVAAGAFTPFCACGTSAVIMGMLTTALPWAPIMAFLTSSPLMSPDGFVLVAGIVGIHFAVALTVASIIIGLGSGFISSILEKKTDFFIGQSRFLGNPDIRDNGETSCSCSSVPCSKDSLLNVNPEKCDYGCSLSQVGTVFRETGHSAVAVTRRKVGVLFLFSMMRDLAVKLKIGAFLQGIIDLGLKRILPFYLLFIAVGYLINTLVPASLIGIVFGADRFYSTILAAVIGLPLYVTTESALPIINSMLASGAGEGAMLAFIIAGSGTSAWVIAGLSTFLKFKTIAFYTLMMLFGAVLSGYSLDFILGLIR